MSRAKTLSAVLALYAGDEAVKECGYYGLSAKELPQFLSKVIH